MRRDHTDQNEHQKQLADSQRRWDFWSSRRWLWRAYEQDTVPIRREAISHLDLDSGDVVLDVGCGPGTNFELLHEAVKPGGQVLGIDYSLGMVERARERIDEHGWENVDVVRADATRVNLKPAAFDGALATTAVSSMPDVRAVIENVYDALCPDSRFAVYDLRPVPSGPARVLNPLIESFYETVGNWNAEADVLEELRTVFDNVTVTRSFALGTNYIAIASKATTTDAERVGHDE